MGKFAICPACSTAVPQRPGRGRPKLIHDECRKAFKVSHKHPATSKEMAEQSTTTNVTWAIRSLLQQEPMTDDQMERITGRSHQSVSAIRRALVRRGLVRDSGEIGKTRYGNKAIKWEWVPE